MALTPGFLQKAGTFTVERAAGHDFGDVDLTKPPVGVGHTTEGSFESAYGKFGSVDAPHFLVGKDAHGKVRICQFVALGRVAGALEHPQGTEPTNGWARAQIELVGFSKLDPWKPDEDVLDAFAALVGTLRDAAGIPLVRPFPNTLDKHVTWATTQNPRRLSGKWGHAGGWWMHLEVPNNKHWDMGAFEWTAAFDRAARYLTGGGGDLQVPSPIPDWFWAWANWRLGREQFRQFGKANPQHRPAGVPTPVPQWAWQHLSNILDKEHAEHAAPAH